MLVKKTHPPSLSLSLSHTHSDTARINKEKKGGKMSNCQQQEYTKKAFGWAARDCGGILAPFNFNRRATGKDDVTIKVLYCGICHTDLHYIKNDFGISSYPLVPGHEIVGVVTEFGHNVTKVKVGDKVGIGYMIESCQSCESCSKSLENYCPKMITTCNGKYDDGKTAYGGFSDIIVANVRYVVHIPDNLPLDGSAPLLCAGVSVYSPMKYFGLVSEPSMHLGVVGLGGLGHVAVKFAKAFGVKVTVISTSSNKEEEAKRLGADLFLVSHDPEQIKVAMGTMDGIIDTVSAFHPILPLIDLLKSHGKLVMVGAPDRPLELPVFPLLMGRKIVAGSCIGGMKEMQEMIDFAGKHNITADIEVVSLDHLNVAFERLAKGDVKYRFVVDVANTLSTAQP